MEAIRFYIDCKGSRNPPSSVGESFPKEFASDLPWYQRRLFIFRLRPMTSSVSLETKLFNPVTQVNDAQSASDLISSSSETDAEISASKANILNKNI